MGSGWKIEGGGSRSATHLARYRVLCGNEARQTISQPSGTYVMKAYRSLHVCQEIAICRLLGRRQRQGIEVGMSRRIRMSPKTFGTRFSAEVLP
jgi:hypothetical protein